MDQGTISAFKAHYIRTTCEQAIAETTEDGAVSLTEFWKNYNIRHAVENIHHAFQEITANNIRGVWKNILPHCANISDFEEETVVKKLTNVGREFGFNGLENDDFRELLNSHSVELTYDVLLLDEQRAFEEAEEQDNVQVNEFTLKEFEDIFRAVEVVKQKIMDADPNLERSMQIRRDVDKALCVYQHMYEYLKKEKIVQSTLLKYFERQ
jgi:hypothetical protein